LLLLSGFLICHVVGSEFLQKLAKDKKIHEARAFNFTCRYIDDVLSINNSRFAEFLPLIYPPEMEAKETFEETPTHMSIKINRLEEGHNSYPLVCRRPAETVSLQRRQICYRWGTPAYWSLAPRSSLFYLFEFCLKNMLNCSLTQQILSHSFYDWKLCELFLLSGFSLH
jgi:hypothetical protein